MSYPPNDRPNGFVFPLPDEPYPSMESNYSTPLTPMAPGGFFLPDQSFNNPNLPYPTVDFPSPIYGPGYYDPVENSVFYSVKEIESFKCFGKCFKTVIQLIPINFQKLTLRLRKIGFW